MDARTRLTTPSLYVAAGSSVMGVLLVLTAMAGPVLLAAAVLLAAVVLAWGWPGMLDLPTPRGTVGVLLGGAVVVVLSVALRTEAPWLGWLPAALSLTMILAFGQQLQRRDGRPRVAVSLSAVVFGMAVLASGSCLLPLARSEPGVTLLAAAMAAVAASAGTDIAGRWSALRAWLAPIALLAGAVGSVVVGALAGALVGDDATVPIGTLVLLGVAAAGVSHAVRHVFAGLPTLAHARPRLVVSAASVLIVGALPYLVAVTLVPGTGLG